MSVARDPFSYATIRIVPHVERGEFINAGVVMFCRRRNFLATRIAVNEDRLRALAPDADIATICEQLDAIASVATGNSDAGPIAELPQTERFGWIVAPSSTVIQPSPVHTGMSENPEATLEALFADLV